MVKPYDTIRIDEDISTTLAHVSLGPLWQAAAHKLLEVGPPGARSPNIHETRMQHAIGFVHLTGLIDKKRPAESCVLHIGTSQETGFEAYHHYHDIQVLKFPFVLPQLQQMPLARQSTQMTVKDH
jgi:hypothetical protein